MDCCRGVAKLGLLAAKGCRQTYVALNGNQHHERGRQEILSGKREMARLAEM